MYNFRSVIYIWSKLHEYNVVKNTRMYVVYSLLSLRQGKSTGIILN